MSVPEPVVSFRGVSHVYASGKPALNHIDMEILPGERVGLVGPSGAGKSTLLRLVNGLVTPSAGEVITLACPVSSMPESERGALRSRVGMIFQEFALIDRLSALTNVLVGRLAYTRTLPSLVRLFGQSDVERARAALAEVGLEGLEGRAVRHLSGGQKQRVGIARTIVQQASLILGDEPTANLDMRTAHEILELLARTSQVHEATLVLSLHDVQAARRHCTRIIALRDGRVAWDGPAQEFGEAEVETVFYT